MIGGISIWQLLILLVIVVLIFGTKRLRNLGGDLGSALKDFRGAMKGKPYKRSDVKKAVVTLAAGQSIDVTSGI